MDVASFSARRRTGDALLVGASGTEQLDEDLADLDKSLLPGNICEVLDSGQDTLWRSIVRVLAVVVGNRCVKR